MNIERILRLAVAVVSLSASPAQPCPSMFMAASKNFSRTVMERWTPKRYMRAPRGWPTSSRLGCVRQNNESRNLWFVFLPLPEVSRWIGRETASNRFAEGRGTSPKTATVGNASTLIWHFLRSWSRGKKDQQGPER